MHKTAKLSLVVNENECFRIYFNEFGYELNWNKLTTFIYTPNIKKYELCSYMNQPNYIKDAKPNEIISNEQYCELTIILNKAEKEKDTITDAEKVAVSVSYKKIF